MRAAPDCLPSDCSIPASRPQHAGWKLKLNSQYAALQHAVVTNGPRACHVLQGNAAQLKRACELCSVKKVQKVLCMYQLPLY